MPQVHTPTKNAMPFKTLEAKKAFEAYCSLYNHMVHHYHWDNGWFANNAFLLDVSAKNQLISFCVMNAQFQNGIAEKAIRDFQDQARKLILHALARWPQAIYALLWPYALRNACHGINILLVNLEGKSRLERFSGINVSPSLKYQNSFGCPVYALHSSLAAGKSNS